MSLPSVDWSVYPSASPPDPPARLPTHLDLPESDGAIVENFLEHPQSILLTESILPVLRQRHPDGRFAIGQDSGIYWKLTDPPLDGCKAPDWFYVPNVPPDLGGQYRRSYVLWQEIVPPQVLIEIVSGDGSEERDQTPQRGKFWVYERAIRAPYYAIYDPATGRLDVQRLVAGRYKPLQPNARGHFVIEPLGLELGVWHGYYINTTQRWLRWFDAEGNMLPNGEERAEQERKRTVEERQRADQQQQRAEQERQRAEQEQKRAGKERQRAEQERQRAEQERQYAEQERQQAEQERQRAEQERQRAEQQRQRAEQELQRAEQEHQRAEQEHQRAERLAARLRELGVDPEQSQ